MTLQEHENYFIERTRKEFGGVMTPETEMLLRYAYATGATELGTLRFHEGVDVQRERVLAALGAAGQKVMPLP
jgi:hypothetical protein